MIISHKCLQIVVPFWSYFGDLLEVFGRAWQLWVSHTSLPHFFLGILGFGSSPRATREPGVRPTDNLLGHTPSCSSPLFSLDFGVQGSQPWSSCTPQTRQIREPECPRPPPRSHPPRPPRPLFPSGPAIGPSRGCRPKQRVNTPPAPRPPQLNGNPSLCIREKKKTHLPISFL